MLGSKKDAPAPEQKSSAPAAAPTPSPSRGGDSQMNALLGKGSEFEGKLSFEGSVRIDGHMKGEVRSKDKLVVGDGAKVEAEVDVGSAEISGEVTGNITAKDRVELKKPARVKGDIATPVLVIEEGVTFDGNCSMSGSSSSSSASLGSSPGSGPEKSN